MTKAELRQKTDNIIKKRKCFIYCVCTAKYKIFYRQNITQKAYENKYPQVVYKSKQQGIYI